MNNFLVLRTTGVTRIFLHGLESSSKGSKATFLRQLFPDMIVPDFQGSLEERMKFLGTILKGREGLIIVGSSFGGLMAVLCAMENQERVDRLVLLAPALNFPDFSGTRIIRVTRPARMIIGKHDTVTPAKTVIPIAEKIFTEITVYEVDDDHMLAKTFRSFDWESFLQE